MHSSFAHVAAFKVSRHSQNVPPGWLCCGVVKVSRQAPSAERRCRYFCCVVEMSMQTQACSATKVVLLRTLLQGGQGV